MFELSFNKVMKYMGTHLLLEDLSFQIYSDERVGIVGPNGCGKSTILKLIAGIEPFNVYIGSWSVGYDKGLINVPKEAKVAYLEQIPVYPSDMLVKEVLMLAFEETRALESKLRLLEEQMKHAGELELNSLLKQYASATATFETAGGYEVEEKYNRICIGLDFQEAFLNRPFELLSGGEKTTVILGKLLMDQPDILLLDEPTNHLDTKAIEWLEGYLKQYKGIVIIVSHDRYFLDQVVEKVIEIEGKTARSYKGNYTDYVRQKEEQVRIELAQFMEQQKKINQMEQAIKSLRDWAIRADNNKFFRRAASMQLKLEKMDKMDRPQIDKPGMKLGLNAVGRTGNETIVATDLCKAYEGKVLFSLADLLVHYRERVVLVGPNGSGKSTFIKMLLGFESADKGQLKIGSGAKVAYLPQEIEFENTALNVLETFRDGIDIPEGKAREYLSKFMFFGPRVFTPVSALSGGERIRLKLSRLLYEEVNLLILDEPTNHLDIDAIETLEEALENFKGTLFFISHDRYFINKIAKRLIAIESGKLVSYEGNYNDYRIELQKRQDVIAATTLKPEPSKKKEKRNEPDEALIKQRAIEKIEKEIGYLEFDLAQIESEMAECGDDYAKLGELYELKNQKQEALDALWESMLQ